MDEKDYLFTIRVPFKALDDIVAKEKVKEMFKTIQSLLVIPDVVVKLQRQVQGKPPEKVQISEK